MNQLFSNLPLLMGGAGTEGQQGSIVPTLVTFGLVFVIFYFLIIRPQNKKKKEAEAMLKSVKKGDHVVSIGGIHGTIVKLSDDTVILKMKGSDAKMTMSRSAISTVSEQSRPAKKVEEVEDVEVEEEVGTEEPAEDTSDAAEENDK